MNKQENDPDMGPTPRPGDAFAERGICALCGNTPGCWKCALKPVELVNVMQGGEP